MSNENFNQDQTTSGGSGGSEDLSGTLGGGETEFVAAEEKKSPHQLIYILLAVALGGGGMFFMYKRQSPSSAEAANPEAAKAQQTINGFLASGPQEIQKMKEMLKNTEKIVEQYNDDMAGKQVPLEALATNPFRMPTAAAPGGTPDQEDQARKREREKQAAMKASGALQLQSIIHSGSRKACMINNTLYMQGQQVEQFVIEKIEPDRVVVKTGAYRFELKMQK
jgi:hypothetical protein